MHFNFWTEHSFDITLNQERPDNAPVRAGQSSWEPVLLAEAGASPAKAASVRASVFTPFSMSLAEESSSGRWLHPFLQGMKIMPVGASCAMNRLSWYALLTMRL